ncbi:hypothetical protein DIPPA_12283 [Diplonema papillatum]|nr:hypothetical protein DIPPA_12283 [Diplonema papillatum]
MSASPADEGGGDKDTEPAGSSKKRTKRARMSPRPLQAMSASDRNKSSRRRRGVPILSLLPPLAEIPEKRKVFKKGGSTNVYFFADVLIIKQHNPRHVLPRKKAKRVLMCTARRIYICSPKTARISREYSIDDLLGLVLSDEGKLGLLFADEARASDLTENPLDLLVRFPHQAVLDKAIRTLMQLYRARYGADRMLEVYRLRPGSHLTDVLTLGDGAREHAFLEHLEAVSQEELGSWSDSEIDAESQVSHGSPKSAASPYGRQRSPASTFVPPPSCSPSSSYFSRSASVSQRASRRSLRGRSLSSRSMASRYYFEDDMTYADLTRKCDDFEIIVAELKGEVTGLRESLEHVEQLRNDGAYQMQLLRQHFESTRQRELADQVHALTAEVASLRSENASLRLRLAEDRAPPTTLVSREVMARRSSAASPPLFARRQQFPPPSPQQRHRERVFDLEVMRERQGSIIPKTR